MCAELGWRQIQTYIQSGNVVFSANGKPAALEAGLERAIENRFGFSISVIVRTAADWAGYLKTNPFPEACEKEPHHVMLCVAKASLKADAVKGLRERAANGEKVAQAGEMIWIHFAGGVARSKLSPSVLDRLAGSPVTARNWLTVLKLMRWHDNIDPHCLARSNSPKLDFDERRLILFDRPLVEAARNFYSLRDNYYPSALSLGRFLV